MTDIPGPYPQYSDIANGADLPLRSIAGTGLTVPVIGQSVRINDDDVPTASSGSDTTACPNRQPASNDDRFGKTAAHRLIDIRLNDGFSTDHKTGRPAINGGITFSDKTTVIARLGLSPEMASRDELMTRVFTRESLLATWEHYESQLVAAESVVLVVEGLAALFNSDLDNEVYFSSCVDQCLRTLSDLKKEGRIAGYGLVADHAEYCQRALIHGPWDTFILNHRYTLLEQWPLYNLLPECEESDTSVIVGHPFNTGVLRGRDSWNFRQPPDYVSARLENIRHICRLHEVPVEAAALQFPLGHRSVVSVLVNAKKHGANNIRRWLEFPITESLWDDLKLGGVMHEEAPVTSYRAVGRI